MQKQSAKKNEPRVPPTFVRFKYQELGGKLKTVKCFREECVCNNPMPKTRAKAAVCANCGGAILTALEKFYVKSLPK
jgi:hypothetical protein